MSDVPNDICANCGEDCTYSENLTFYVTGLKYFSFCDDDCFNKWLEKQEREA